MVHQCDSSRREPGYILLSVGKDIRAISTRSACEVLIALNVCGEVAWYWESDVSLMDVRLTSHGTLIVLTTDGSITEINFSGQTVRRWISPSRNPLVDKASIPVNTPYFHHSVITLPNGNLAALSISNKIFKDYPLDENDYFGKKGMRTLVGDTLIEFQPNGSIVSEFSFFDILDPYRFGYGLDAPFWSIIGLVKDGADWTHANGLGYDSADDSFIITVRHQDCLIKIDRQTGQLKWILGCPDGWKSPWSEKLLKPVGKTSWHWHSHDPSIMKDGSFMLFDNGQSGAFPPSSRPDINSYSSRAVAYEVNEEAMTVEEIWSFGGENDIAPYSMYVSGAIELPFTGNIFVTFGGITLTRETGERTDMPPLGHGSVELFEVTRSKEPEVLFHAEINNRDTKEVGGWAAFRSEWLPENLLKP